MKKITIVFALVFIAITSTAQEATKGTITVTIENVLSDGGTLLGGLHTTDTFMKGTGVINAMAPALAGEVTLIFENVEPGDYAIMVMHDKNDNKQMDMDANGMPKESYGMSGDVNPYGPPSFDGSKFEFTGEDQEIRLRF